MFVTERPGRVRVIRDGAVLGTPFLDVTAITLTDDSERGLLSMAFAPDYATSGRFYVYLTARPAGAIEIREYRRSAANPDVADPASGRLLLTIAHDEAANHNGGQLQFGPDGKLWLATGDGGGGNDEFHHAQDPGSLLGKLIRLDPAAPAPEVLARGLRNPWRFSFDRATGQIVIADVGQGAVEEVDVGPRAPTTAGRAGRGRRRRASDPACDAGTAMPVADQVPWRRRLLLDHRRLRRARPRAADARSAATSTATTARRRCARSTSRTRPATPPTGLSVPDLSSFGEDACGRILVVSLAGPVYRLVDGTPSPCGVGGDPGARR